MNLKYEVTLNVDNEWKMNRHHFHDEFEILLSLSDAGHVLLKIKSIPWEKVAYYWLRTLSYIEP